MSRKVAIVVQRCHHSIVGGSEALAWHYATLLREAYEVDVLTTTALDYSDWANALPEGAERREGVRVRRFHVTHGRGRYWGGLYQRLLSDYAKHCAAGRRVPGPARFLPWSTALQEEFIRQQGPYSEPLLRFIRESWAGYRRVIFVTYLYPTSYFGLLEVPPRTALFVPTLHDEPTAYLSAYRQAARRAGGLVWLTEAERNLGHDLWGELPGRVVSMAIDARLRKPARSGAPYLLYCGRIDLNKGCLQLFEYFVRYKEENPGAVRLVLAGEANLPVPEHRDIEYLGFVDAEEKFRLMAGASVLVMPSNNESFSIVTLEAMSQGTPVLSSGGGEVLREHITRSNAGRIYDDYEGFAAALNELLADESERASRGEWAREYVNVNYRPETVRASLIEAIESGAESAAADV